MCSNCNNEHHHDEDCCCCECCEEEKELVRDRRELTDEEIESIIVEKYNTKDEKTKVFIRKALKVQGDWYDYSKVEYKGCKTKIAIICPIQEHGEFLQRPSDHLKGQNCPKCSRRFQYTTDSFIKEANRVHNNKYDYSNTIYSGYSSSVIVGCKKHGEFSITASYHLKGHGCPKCSEEDRVESNKENFIKKAKETHNNEYDYSKVEYINSYTEVIIGCKKHGFFSITPRHHLYGFGCQKCGIESRTNQLRMSQEEFISRANLVHGNRYDYSKVKYINSLIQVEIICPKHGSFYRDPHNHLLGIGCPHCIDTITAGESDVIKFLTDNNLTYSFHEYIKSDIYGMYPDFILDDNTWIEYNGEQHYKYVDFFYKGDMNMFILQLGRDLNKREFCIRNNIRLIEIPYTYSTYEKVSNFLDKVLLQNIDPNTLIDYSKLYKLDNTGLNLEDLFPT